MREYFAVVRDDFIQDPDWFPVFKTLEMAQLWSSKKLNIVLRKGNVDDYLILSLDLDITKQ